MGKVMAGRSRFSSRVGTLYFVILGIVLVVASFPIIRAIEVGHWGTVALLAIPILLVASQSFSTFYVVSGETLTVHWLVFRRSIPLRSIKTLRSTHNPTASPALSLDRIEVVYDGGMTLLSPKDKAGFIQAIIQAQPTVAVDDAFITLT